MFNSFGNIFRLTSFGESHGPGVGGVIDGFPAGITIDMDFVQQELNRRRPGQSLLTTSRQEPDKVEFLSGIFEGKSTGCPIGFIVWNKNQHSNDYENIRNLFRPSHADFTYTEKYGFRDYRGGGRSSGRETIGRVAAGAIAVKLLEVFGISVTAYSKSIGEVSISPERFDILERDNNPVAMPDKEAAIRAQELLEKKIEEKDSVGGIVECIVKGMKTGVGEPVFDKLDARLSQAIMSIGAVKGFEIGAGFAVANMVGSENNDNFTTDSDNNIVKKTNNAGGILGGISDGSDIVLRAAFKPTPSIYRMQETVNKNHENINIEIKGRHDPIIVPRAVVVVEAMTAITVLDMLMISMTSTVDGMKRFFER